ncbi:MAG: ATP-binding cassette domain-containing protein [Pseudobdellovibrio sp.]
MSILIENLSLTLTSQKIFVNISLDIKSNTFHSIIGLSGAGKSQFIRTLADLNQVHQRSPINNEVSIAFQNSQLIPWLSAFDNVKMCCTLSDTEIDQLFVEFNLINYKNFKPRELSGGMQQRVSLIRAFAHKNELLLLDEPFSMLDLVNKRANQDYLLAYWQKYKGSVLFISHDIDEALFLSQQVHFLSRKKKTITHSFNIQQDYPRDYLSFKNSDEYKNIYRELFNLLTEDSQNA